VDDQEGNLVVFKANFKKYIGVTTATSAEKGLAALEKEEFSVVISDQKMPGMSGTEFLAAVRKRHPDTARMLLSAYTDFDDAVAAINEGQVTRFISKPWQPQELLGAISTASELYFKTKENRNLTEQLLHRERLAAIGQVTSGLVHELANIATVFTPIKDLPEMWLQGEDPTMEFEILRTGVDRFTVLLESIRIFARGGEALELQTTTVDLNHIVETTLLLLRLFPAVRGLRRLDFVPGEGPIEVLGDRKKLEQVVLNVVKNAAEACPPRGQVKVWLEVDATSARIHVSDNGPGVPASVAQKIYSGFCSTKGQKGTGLGLAMCHRIMKAHGGSIDFVNSHHPQAGCTFVLTFPRA
jgi:signal transduction histidine kinase